MDYYQGDIVPATILLPIIMALLNYRFLSRPLKIILGFLLFSGIVNLMAVMMAHRGISNLLVFHIYAIFEFAFISWFYKLYFKGRVAKIIPILIGTFTILCIINVCFIQNYIVFNTYTRSLEAILIVGYGILFFSKQGALDNDFSWGEFSLNWINVGILIYYSGSFFTFIFSNYLLVAVSQRINIIIWNVVDTLLLLEYVLFAIGFYKCRNQPITSSSL
jgi:hypothetical protein